MDEVIEEEEDESKSDQPVTHSKTAAVNSIGGRNFNNDLLSFNHNSEKRLDDELLFSQDKPREKDMSKINRTETRKSMKPGQSPFVNVETLRQDANASQGPRRKSTIR